MIAFFASATSNKTGVFGVKTCSYPPPVNRMWNKSRISTEWGFWVWKNRKNCASNSAKHYFSTNLNTCWPFHYQTTKKNNGVGLMHWRQVFDVFQQNFWNKLSNFKRKKKYFCRNSRNSNIDFRNLHIRKYQVIRIT